LRERELLLLDEKRWRKKKSKILENSDVTMGPCYFKKTAGNHNDRSNDNMDIKIIIIAERSIRM